MDVQKQYFRTKEALYDAVYETAKAMTEETNDTCAVLSNVSALLMLFMPHVSWAGFYLWKQDRLFLGPFQGKPAVAEIALGRGVCGTACAKRRTQIVEDVHACANHIACDASTASEIVVPLIDGDALYGVIDIDSRDKGRFDEDDARGLERLARLLCETLFQNGKAL